MDSIQDFLIWFFDTPKPLWDRITMLAIIVGPGCVLYFHMKERWAEQRRSRSASLNIPTDLEDYDG